MLGPVFQRRFIRLHQFACQMILLEENCFTGLTLFLYVPNGNHLLLGVITSKFINPFSKLALSWSIFLELSESDVKIGQNV